MSTDDLRLLGQSIVDTCNALDAATAGLADSAAKLAVAEQVATEDAAELAQLKSDNAALQAYKDAHPDAPPPPPASPPPPPASKVGWGFNLFNGWNGYSQPAAAESSSVMLKRLTTTFGPFGWGKAFNPGFLPTTFAKSTQGETDPACPASNFVECFVWTPGTIASGANDARLTAYFRSVQAASKRVIVTLNEVDHDKVSGAQWPLYVADMDRMFDLVESLNLGGAVEVRDCFMNYSLQPASGPAWKDSWTNPKKRHGIIFDAYCNQAHVDSNGATTVKQITDMLAHLGFTPAQCIIGEWGDRRPNDASTPAGVKLADATVTDANRATQFTTRTAALVKAGFGAIIHFDVVGSTGDHRILPADTATAAVLRGFMQA